MSTEWDGLINDLAILNGEGNRDQGYKELCSSTALTNLWSIVEKNLKPSTAHLQRLRELLEVYETEYYNEVVKPKIVAKIEDTRSEAEKAREYKMTLLMLQLGVRSVRMEVRISALEALLEGCKAQQKIDSA